MKILYFSTSIIPSRFANSVNTMKMSSALADIGCEVKLIAEKGKNAKDVDVFKQYGVQKNFDVSLIEIRGLGATKRIRVLLGEIQKYDIVYTRYALAAYVSSFFRGKKVVYEHHDVPQRNRNRLVEKKLLKRKNVMHVFITRFLQTDYEKKIGSSKGRSIVLPDAADYQDVIVGGVRDERKLSCGYIGSFQKGKGVELVCEMAKRLGDSVTFNIVGGSNEEIKTLREKYPSENIVWHGFLSQPDAMRVLRDEIDIALLPNQRNVYVGTGKRCVDIGAYTSPMKLFEYMSYGKAIIASNLGVLKEVLEDRKNAILVEADNVEQWVGAIKELDMNRELLDKIGINAHNDFMKKYTWGVRAKKVVKNLTMDDKDE